MSNPTPNLAKALSQLQGDLKPIPKDSENPFFHSAYSSLTACWETVRPLLKKYGLAVTQTTITTDKLLLITTLMHESGEIIVGQYPIYSKDNSPQSLGSAISYAKRYALQAILGLASEDDDGNDASAPTPPKTQRAPSYQGVSKPQAPTPEGSKALTAKQLQLIQFTKQKNKIAEDQYLRIIQDVGGVGSDTQIPFVKVNEVLGALQRA